MLVTWEAQRRRPCHYLKPLASLTDNWQLFKEKHKEAIISVTNSIIYWHTLPAFTKVAHLFSKCSPKHHLTRQTLGHFTLQNFMEISTFFSLRDRERERELCVVMLLPGDWLHPALMAHWPCTSMAKFSCKERGVTLFAWRVWQKSSCSLFLGPAHPRPSQYASTVERKESG